MKKLYEKAKKLVGKHPRLLILPLALLASINIFFIYMESQQNSFLEFELAPLSIPYTLCLAACLFTIATLIGIISENPMLMSNGHRLSDDLETMLEREKGFAAVGLLITAATTIIEVISFAIWGIIFLISLI